MTPAHFEQWLQSPADHRRPLVMGVLNVTPDSFSDGGRFLDPAAAAEQAGRMLGEGADLLDIGGESTRPGSQPVPDEEQIRRIVPVIAEVVRQHPGTVVSVDTTRSNVANAAISAGAAMLNDISAGRDDPAYLPLAARLGVPIALMHMQGTPATMQASPSYGDVVAEVALFLRQRAAVAIAQGVQRHRIVIDPGIGFGKTLVHNLSLMRGLGILAGEGMPILVGTSRKGFIGTITGVARATDRIHGTAATVAWSIQQGAGIVRVHDVGPMVQVVRMIRAIQHGFDA